VSTGAVTILLPVKHYRPDYLAKALRSVDAQHHRECRVVIIVEPGADAGVREVAGGSGLPPIELVVNEGRGLPGAINTGMRNSRTPFVALLFADDMLAGGAVATLNDYIARYPDVDFFHSSRVIIDEDDRAISSVYPSRETFELAEFPWGSPVKHLLCWRRDKGLEIGGVDESLNSIGADDYDFPWTMVERGAMFKAIGECLYRYRNHCEHYRLTTHVPLSVHRREIARILKKHGVGWLLRRLIIAARRLSGSLGAQCLYRSPLDLWIKELQGRDVRGRWRQVDYRRGSRQRGGGGGARG
jgi:glycosyltransferase involved in cell wall biosynthesis